MFDPKLKQEKKKVDTKEFQVPETVFVRDVENRVFQSIVVQCLSQIEGVCLVEGNFIDNLLGRNTDGLKGIHTDQDEKNHTVRVRVEVNVLYGISIPEKAEEIQNKVIEEIVKITGLHVASVHVVFKNVITQEQMNRLKGTLSTPPPLHKLGEEFSEEY